MKQDPGTNRGRILDLEEVEASLKRAAHRAIYGTRWERSGRFRPVQPSTVRSIRYDHGARELEIAFANGSICRYQNVPLKIYVDLLDSGSKDEFFNAKIKGEFAHSEAKFEPQRG
jgi:hypothetical protein